MPPLMNPKPAISPEAPAARRRIDRHLDSAEAAVTMLDDIRRGLTGEPKSLPPKYFYDEAGSALFERITSLTEYYPTRAELGLLSAVGGRLMAGVFPVEVVELGPGSTEKVRCLLDGPGAADSVRRYVPFDVDLGMVEAAVVGMTETYPSLAAHGVVGDFERHLDRIPPRIGRRLIAFFGSTIGNLDPEARVGLLSAVRRQLAGEDRLLLGVDLVKGRGVLEAAYDDAEGVTAEFNRNILSVVNRAAGGDFDPAAFRHRAVFNEDAARVEMHLIAETRQRVVLRDLDVVIEMAPGETIWTESSYKFTRESAEGALRGAGMTVERWESDPQGLFALVVAAPV